MLSVEQKLNTQLLSTIYNVNVNVQFVLERLHNILHIMTCVHQFSIKCEN